MHILSRIGIVSLLSFMMIFGLLPAASAQEAEAETVYVIAYACVEPGCPRGDDSKVIPGAEITSYNAAGEVVDVCAIGDVTTDYGVGCALVPAPEGGSYVITPPAGYEHYTLMYDAPQYAEDADGTTILIWYYTPSVSGEEPDGDRIIVTAVACAEAGCPRGTEIVGIIGAEITSYNAADEVVDLCAVAERSTDYGSGCAILPAPADGYYDIIVPPAYENHTLVSTNPAVGETDDGILVLIWTFEPVADVAAPQPDTTTPKPAVVTALPSTGVGPESASGLPLLAVPFLLAGLAMIGTRAVRKH